MLNAVLLAVIVMLVLSLARVHVVLALFIGAVVGGLVAGLGLDATMVAFQEGLAGGAQIALAYALLGAFAMAVASSGLPDALAAWIVGRLGGASDSAQQGAVTAVRWALVAGVLAMSVMSQNLIPVHIAFIPLLIPPLLVVMNRLRLDRRAIACTLTFGLVTTYMLLPVGFGSIYLNDILLGNIEKAGMPVGSVNVMAAMGIPAAGMAAGLLVALLVSYRRPRMYADVAVGAADARPNPSAPEPDDAGEAADAASSPAAAARRADEGPSAGRQRFSMVMSLVAVAACFAIQLVLTALESEANPLLVGALVGLALMLGTGAVPWRRADDVFTGGMRMMALIGFIMIAAQGFAAVMTATGQVEPLVKSAAELVGDNRGAAALAMLVVGLVVTLGIGSSFSTLPIIATIYVPLCASLGFSPAATVALIGTAGALGDAGSPASDSTLGPTAGLNADGQHDHIRDSVIPTFLHFNLPLLAAGWIAAMVL
ncbi:Na+/H+ antiporter family protein [Helcobacillus massiliensis]|uniref:Na+/H+ antiporter family protein n=2 Tax=Helcobacillus massiliensis TaxID=521392 RepID=UPI0025521738|nr:Na+/H+ antiporter NhaC family protein [Helcobacillus massiliensis]MDK7742614.1 Na+/H+ antiporter NhaC family protein [Helcobacillus massiliensis]WOO92553.1 Na+/H+ antiporter NhaC family protein [Helcobacillus massiliensis]